jgi:hypothetical protein
MSSYARFVSSMQSPSHQLYPDFALALDPALDSSFQIYDETEKELVFQQKCVSISPYLRYLQAPKLHAIHSQYHDNQIHQDYGEVTQRLQQIYDLHSWPNIYLRSWIEFSISHHMVPN